MWVEKLMERDYFLDANQALEMGLVDKVLMSREEQDQAMGPLKGGGDGGKEGEGGQNGQGPSPQVSPSPS
jgi:Clp protease